MAPKIWCCVCALFLLYAIVILSGEREEILFVSVSNSSELYDYAVCVNLKNELFANKTKLDLDEFNGELYLYFFQKKNTNDSMSYNKFNDTMLNLVRQRAYFFYKDHFCLSRRDKETQYYVGSFLTGKRDYFIFKPSTYDLFKMVGGYGANVDQRVIIYKEWPHSNCLRNYSKFGCLNSCSKKRHRLSKYYFGGREKGVIHLAYDYNETVKTTEYACLERCKWHDCKVSAFKKAEGAGKTRVYEAKFMISEFDYWAQLLGLLALHLSISLYQVLAKLIEFAGLKLEKFRRFKRFNRRAKLYRNLGKMATLLIIMACSLYQSVEMIKNFRSKFYSNSTELEMKTYLLKSEPLSLVLCLPIDNIVYSHHEKLNRTYKNHGNLSLLELERLSDGLFDATPKEIYLKFGDERFEVNWVLTPKVLFSLITSGSIHLCRCFKIDVRPSEPAYQSLFSESKLIVMIEPNENQYAGHELLYLLPEGQNFNSKSFRFAKKHQKKIIKRSKCVDYKRKSCGSRQDCLERCVHRKVFDKYKRVDLNLVVDKDDFLDEFSEKNWENSVLEKNFDDYEAIERECQAKYPGKDCHEISFELPKESHVNHSPDEKSGKEIELLYDVVSVVENDPSIYGLVIDILNVQSILLGMNVFKLLLMIYGFVAVKLRLRKSRIHHLLFIYPLVLPGFVYHLYSIFSGVLHGELVHYASYLLLGSAQLPEIIYCLDYERTRIDHHHELTRKYLDKLTEGDLGVEHVFDKFVYLSEINEWVTLPASAADGQSKELQVHTFYLAKKKCFRIWLEVNYKMFQFDFVDDKRVLKVYFNEEFTRKERDALFFTKTRNATQFSKSSLFTIHHDYEKYHKFKRRYTIFQDNLLRSFNDKFASIKHPLSLFQSDDDKDLSELNQDFEQNFGRRTLKLPVEDDCADLPIDDAAFDQFNRQLHNATKSPPKANFERQFVTISVKVKHESGTSLSNSSDFDFHLNFWMQTIKITNEENVVKLLISLLNVLSIWLDLGILDLHTHVRKLKTPFIALHGLIKAMKSSIGRALLNEAQSI